MTSALWGGFRNDDTWWQGGGGGQKLPKWRWRNMWIPTTKYTYIGSSCRMKNIFNLIVVYYLWGKKVFSFEALELCTLFNLSPAAKQQQQHPCDFSWIRYSDGPIFHFASRLIAFLERVFREFGCFPQLSSFCHSST